MGERNSPSPEKRFIKKKEKLTFEGYASGFFLLLISVLLIAQIFTRYVLNSSLTWSEELSTYCYVWSVFLGASAIIYSDDHLKIDFFEKKFSKQKQKIFRYLYIFSSIAFYILLFYLSLLVTIKTWNVTTVSLNFSMGIVFIIIPIASILAIINSLKLLKKIKS